MCQRKWIARSRHEADVQARVLLPQVRQYCRLNICRYIGYIDNTNFSVLVNSTNISTNIETAALSMINMIKVVRWY